MRSIRVLNVRIRAVPSRDARTVTRSRTPSLQARSTSKRAHAGPRRCRRPRHPATPAGVGARPCGSPQRCSLHSRWASSYAPSKHSRRIVSRCVVTLRRRRHRARQPTASSRYTAPVLPRGRRIPSLRADRCRSAAPRSTPSPVRRTRGCSPAVHRSDAHSSRSTPSAEALRSDVDQLAAAVRPTGRLGRFTHVTAYRSSGLSNTCGARSIGRSNRGWGYCLRPLSVIPWMK